jgi:hypothetical protein
MDYAQKKTFFTPNVLFSYCIFCYILILDKRIGDKTGYFGIKEISRRSLEDREVYSYGYPSTTEDENYYKE